MIDKLVGEIFYIADCRVNEYQFAKVRDTIISNFEDVLDDVKENNSDKCELTRKLQSDLIKEIRQRFYKEYYWGSLLK
jgi:hypothetical protein